MFPRAATPLLLAGGLFLMANTAHAQAAFSIGPRLGLNVATYHFSPSNGATQEYHPGFEAGLMGSAGFGHFALQPALLYSQKGYSQVTSVDIRTGTNLPVGTGEQRLTTRLNYLTLPLNLAYTQHANGQGLQVFAGPYLSLLVSGKYENTTTLASTATTESGKITPIANDAPDFNAYARRLDAGLQAGLGYRHQALLLQLGYSMGLRDIAARYYYTGGLVGNPAYYNRAFQASLSYLFGRQD